jgi:cobalt/nickel transport system permease protein
MAVVMPFVSYWVFKLLRGDAKGGARLYVSAFLAGWAGLSVASVVAGFEFGIQPIIASGADGRPLYAPYPLSVAVPAMALEHMLVFGIVEGLVTALILKFFVKHESELVYAMKEA